ncbi:hypothetical protein ACVWXO_008091 [Bradyrhizobium sp. LM2.7]
MPADLVLRTLGTGGPQAMKLADIMQSLVIEAGKLGELEIAQYMRPTGELVKVKRFPAIWLARLDKAIETNSLERLPTERIVMALLDGPR